MSTPIIGVDIDDFRVGPKAGLTMAAELQFRVVEMATVAGDVAAWNLSSSGRRHLARFVSGLGLRFASLVADMPDLRLRDPGAIDERVERSLRVVELAADMNVPIVTTSVGPMTDLETCEPLPAVLEALSRIGEYADSRGRVLGIRPSFDSGDRLTAVLDALNCPSVRVCLDPAELVMGGSNPIASFEKLAGRIALVHTRDATAGTPHRSGHEVRLGTGEVDLVGVLAALDAAEYRGDYVLRRTDSQSPGTDLTDARDVLERLLPAG